MHWWTLSCIPAKPVNKPPSQAQVESPCCYDSHYSQLAYNTLKVQGSSRDCGGRRFVDDALWIFQQSVFWITPACDSCHDIHLPNTIEEAMSLKFQAIAGTECCPVDNGQETSFLVIA